MPFSFSNIGTTAIVFMVACLAVAELIKYVRKNMHHSEK
jgi:cell division protein ZapA (FtsZ GTPase activity inhibitor)